MDISKLKLFYLIPVLILLTSQLNCVSEKTVRTDEVKPIVENIQETPPKAQFPAPLEADVERERIEGQKLADGGISFENTLSAHGPMTEKGVEFGSNEFKSSDGVLISRTGKLYHSSEELNRAFEKSKAKTDKIFLNSKNKKGEPRFDGASGKGALVVYISGSYLYTVSCPSVRHLIAFEMKESAYFANN